MIVRSTEEQFVLELDGIYGLDEGFMLALPDPSLEMWKMLVRENAKRHVSERNTMESFRKQLIELKFGPTGEGQ